MVNTWQTTPGVLNITEENTVPFMAVKEYEYIRDLMNAKGYINALEWGSGSSTIWFPENTNIEYWLAIESDKVYYDYLKDKVGEKVELLLIQDKDDYIQQNITFDFILIDGLYRDECLKKALQIISPEGTIILHDSGRKEYKQWYSKYPHKIIFEGEGWLGDGWDHRGLCAFTKN